ncbi:MAG TPA: sigma-70 family RNA polymerase sigma factor [Bryobacteraceae bacterium]|jgi:RNA polymerase sigma-70 factor (ECF subfamily)|nr:sigma-70 family RNA polymerase sigma factor [Bryobacteraceae bacterium]
MLAAQSGFEQDSDIDDGALSQTTTEEIHGTDGPPNWAELVERIRQHDPSGLEDLYSIFSRGIRFFLCRQLGPQELDDRVHDTFLIVVNAIQRGDLREPERLMGFVRTVVRRQVAAYIDRLVHSRREQIDVDSSCRIADRTANPEQTLASREITEMMLGILRSLSERDREILTRFYLREQSQEQICTEMELSETQFRLLKSRAKARFGELGKKRLQQNSLVSLFVRTSSRARH